MTAELRLPAEHQGRWPLGDGHTDRARGERWHSGEAVCPGTCLSLLQVWSRMPWPCLDPTATTGFSDALGDRPRLVTMANHAEDITKPRDAGLDSHREPVLRAVRSAAKGSTEDGSEDRSVHWNIPFLLPLLRGEIGHQLPDN